MSSQLQVPELDWTKLQIPAALDTECVNEEQLPWVPLDPTTESKLYYVNLKDGLWCVRNRMLPGTTLVPHKHTGVVLAFTLTGSWYYLESPDAVNRPGSFLYEPAGSTHTFHVPEDSDGPADVFFAIWGANLNLDEQGHIASVLDAGTMLGVYNLICETLGHGNPPVQVDR